MNFLKKHWIVFTIVGVVLFLGYLAYKTANNLAAAAADATDSLAASLNPVNWIKAGWAFVTGSSS